METSFPQTDIHGETSIPPTTLLAGVGGGLINNAKRQKFFFLSDIGRDS